MKNLFYLLLELSLLAGLSSCSGNTIAAGKDGIQVETGDWTSDDGSFMIEFRIATDGSSIFISTYSFPCGDRTNTVFPPELIKVELNNSTFEMNADHTYLTGTFTDRTQVEGTWKVIAHRYEYLDLICPAANGTWKGSPK
jgi:hypothetical protein